MKASGPLTKTLLRDWQPESRSDPYLWDGEVRGLGLRVTAGSRSYVFRYRDTSGKQRVRTLHSTDEVTYKAVVEEALALRVEVNKARREGRRDPLTEGDRLRDLLSRTELRRVAELAAVYQERHAPPKISAGHHSNNGYLWSAHIVPAFGRVEVSEVTPDHVAGLHAAMGKTPTAANRVVRLLRHALGQAIRWGWRAEPNPASGLVEYPESGAKRVLTDDEIRSLWRTLEWQLRAKTEGQRATHRRRCALYVRLLLMTAARPGELRTARPSWVLWDESVIVLPRVKADRAGRDEPEGRVIGLGPAALADLRELAELAEHDLLLPSNRKPGEPISRTAALRAWNSICRLAGIEDAVPYSARHTWVTRSLRGARVALTATRDAAGHSDVRTTLRYDHGDLAALRATAAAVESHLGAI